MMRVKADGVDPSRVGTMLYWDEVEDVTSAHLPGDEDANSAHLTIIWDAGKATAIFADFTYNRARAIRLCDAAQEFLDAASWSLAQENLRAFIDNLFSAAELTAKGFFFTFADPGVTGKTNHKAIHTRVNKHSMLGNLGDDFGNVFNTLRQQRSQARYSDEVPQRGPDPEWLKETVDRTLAALRARVSGPRPSRDET